MVTQGVLAASHRLVIPVPTTAQASSGSFDLRSATSLCVSEPALLGLAERFRADLMVYADVLLSTPPAVEALASTGSIRLELRALESPERVTRGLRADGAVVDGERHRLTVTVSGVHVVGATEEAVQRGLTSLLQEAAVGAGIVRCGRIDDAPELAWRGLSLDVVRWFVPVEEVKRVIDVLALYKLNVLHLHLTDNEGWRLEIDGWPGLTEQSVDGWYTQDDFRDLVAYGRDRFVTVVPEIDLPGHAAAVLSAYPQLGVCEPHDDAVPFRRAYLDPNVEETWTFVEDVLSQVAAISPAPFLHLGGDEVFGMDGAAYLEFVDRALAVARRLGKRVVGWQETCRAGVGPDEVVQHWIDVAALTNGDASSSGLDVLPADVPQEVIDHFREALGDLGRIAEKGARLLLSPTTTFYLDQPHGDPSVDPDQEAARARLGLQMYTARTLEQLLDWNVEAAASGVAPEALAGVEAALWCESVGSAEDLELLLLPRIAGIAELGWNATAHADWASHRERLAAHALMWERAGWSWFRAASVEWEGHEARRG